MKKIILLAFFGLGFFSCSQDDSIDSQQNDTKISLALKIEKGNFTRSLQTPGTTSLSVESMIIEIFDEMKNKIGNNVVLNKSVIDIVTGGSELPVLGDPGRIVVEGIDSRAAYVRIWAFQKEGVNTLPVNLTGSINDYQTEFNMIPFYPVAQPKSDDILGETDSDGFVKINKTDSPAPGPGGSEPHTTHKIWTAQAMLQPYFARFEVAPTVSGGGVVADMTTGNFPAGTTIKVTGIYINAIPDTKGGTVHTNKGNFKTWGLGDWDGDNRYTGTGTPSWSNMFNVTGNSHDSDVAIAFGTDCYNLFPQAGSLHVIVRVLVELDPTSDLATTLGYSSYYGFVTIKDFNVTSGAGKLSQAGIQAGKIYRTALDLTLKPGDIQPDPESSTADLYADIVILEWQEVTLTPDI